MEVQDIQKINLFEQEEEQDQMLLHTNNHIINQLNSQHKILQTLNQHAQSNQQLEIQQNSLDSNSILYQQVFNQDNANQADNQITLMHQSFVTSGIRTFGIVQIIVDLRSGQLRAQKYFQISEHHRKELQNYKNMNDEFLDKQKKICTLAIQPDGYNEQKKTILVQA